jgi:hypothetical protein
VESRLKHPVIPPFSWSTTSQGGSPHTSLKELSVLGDHLHLCRKSSDGHFAILHGYARATQGFVASRFVTTLMLLGLVMGIGLMAR